MRRQHVIAGTLILAGSAAIAVSVLLPTPGVIPASRAEPKGPAQPGSARRSPLVFFPPLPPVPTAAEHHTHWSPRSNSGRTSFSTTRSPIPRATPASNATPRRRAARRGWSQGSTSAPARSRGSSRAGPGLAGPRPTPTRHSAPRGRTTTPSSPWRGSAATSGTVASPTSRPRLGSRLSIRTRWPIPPPTGSIRRPRGVIPPSSFKKSRTSSYAPLFQQIYGADAFTKYTVPDALHPDHRSG